MNLSLNMRQGIWSLIEESQAQGTKARQNESAGEAVKSAYEDIVRQEGEMICKSRPVLCPTLSQRARKDGATHFCEVDGGYPFEF
jgi:hypothetical protein